MYMRVPEFAGVCEGGGVQGGGGGVDLYTHRADGIHELLLQSI